MPLTEEQLADLAARQLADFDARTPGTAFAEGLELDVAEAYAVQATVADLRQQRGEKVIGYKVGCTSPTIREQLGISHSITGRLFDSEQHVSGATLSRSDFASLAIEGELAIELACEPTPEDFAGGANTIPQCVARVFPVIELHHLVMRGKRPTAGELIANNAIHGGVVAGRGVARDEIIGEASLSIFVDDERVEGCDGDVLIETIETSLAWLARIARERGEPLAAGQVILTGSVPGLIPITDDSHVRVEAPPFGQVEVQFTE
jgi:2-keto-4-pentenoate hydratase